VALRSTDRAGANYRDSDQKSPSSNVKKSHQMVKQCQIYGIGDVDAIQVNARQAKSFADVAAVWRSFGRNGDGEADSRAAVTFTVPGGVMRWM
jgi:hypothetical protein